MTQERFDAIFKKCEHEATPGWHPPIYSKCNEFMEEKDGTESKRGQNLRAEERDRPLQGEERKG